MDEISKKDLLAETGISYGQLYRWKREGLIPEEWFVKRPSFTGQETFFPKEKITERVRMILDMKDEQSLDEIRKILQGEEGGELEGLIEDAVKTAARNGTPASVVLFEAGGTKHYILLGKDGKAVADEGVGILMSLSEKEVRGRVKKHDGSEYSAEQNTEQSAEQSAEQNTEQDTVNAGQETELKGQ